MSEEAKSSTDPRDALRLKLTEPNVSAEQPWADDVLDRRELAERLTRLIQDQSVPFTISIHGQWGTGKTFLLKRWQKDLESQGFKAIYFNAWEDDFCDDPLLAILGQLADYFKEDRLKELARSAAKVALPLIRENALGVLKATIGITLKADIEKQNKGSFLDAYLEQKATRDKLKKHLTKLSSRVSENTGHSLVFIIDELDRCRPTFAVELLERVKHIFDVPNMVFVFRLNRDELCKSLQSIYGEIDAEVYLRRFFDMEFNLPEVNSQKFAEHLIESFQLEKVFQCLDKAAHSWIHLADYDNYRKVFPKLWSALGLSLRDIDYGIRLLALLARNVPLGTFTHPFLLAVLIAMKFKKSEFYHSLVTGGFRTSEIMDYIDDELRRDLMDEGLSRHLDRSEGFLYCADSENREDQPSGQAAMDELERMTEDVPSLDYFVVSQRAQNADPQQRSRIYQAISDGRSFSIDGKVFSNLASLIDTYQDQLRR